MMLSVYSMMTTQKYPYSLVLVILIFQAMTFIGCQSEKSTDNETESTAQQPERKISAKDIASISYTEYALSDSAEKLTTSWFKFQELNSQIEILKTGDLSFFTEDLTFVDEFLTELSSEIPDTLNETSILVRLSALKTSIYKLEGSASLERESKEALLNNLKEVLLSHTNLIFQINKKLEKDAQNITRPQ
ncbi:MAG: hypothetical protein HKN00_01440 [Flavobacteriaceae bacterium]|nr:hypothetical protein [Flavobacteriaceae bacterium]NNK71990.1 hypothetical protein [Flavobacteriaceae bacterium]